MHLRTTYYIAQTSVLVCAKSRGWGGGDGGQERRLGAVVERECRGRATPRARRARCMLLLNDEEKGALVCRGGARRGFVEEGRTFFPLQLKGRSAPRRAELGAESREGAVVLSSYPLRRWTSSSMWYVRTPHEYIFHFWSSLVVW